MNSEQAARLRAEMVERQLRGRGIRDENVLAVMAQVPRELFVPVEMLSRAYLDGALPIAAGQTISQPYMVAHMTELLELRPGMRVLEVGTGSGYGAAVLAGLGASVISVERHPELAEAARDRLAGLGLALGFAKAVRVVVGDGSLGWPDEAPFGGIIVAAAAPRVPAALPAQLADGGRLVVPVGMRGRQELILVVRRGDSFEERACGPCVFVPLIGEGGFAEPAPGSESARESGSKSGRRRRWFGRSPL
jgi:protein-L-isoaspartate(D-aspartate) O-methyltransferase